MIYCSSDIYLLAQTSSLNVKLISATTARMTITGICAFPFCLHVLHVFCNSTCVLQLYMYCACLSITGICAFPFCLHVLCMHTCLLQVHMCSTIIYALCMFVNYRLCVFFLFTCITQCACMYVFCNSTCVLQ